MGTAAQPFERGGIVRDSPYAWYVAAVMAMCQAVSFIDRQLINLLIGPIKAEYGLSDTSVSLLIGVAFTTVHVLLAIPIGRWVDRGNRRMTIFVCGIAWSLSAMLGGLVDSYGWLFVSRMGVGAAEAGVYTACAATVAAYFTPAKLPRAMSISLLGPFVGGGLSLIFGGLVIGALEKVGPQVLPVVGLLKPWQMTLSAISAAGMLPILLVLTVKEPTVKTPEAGPALIPLGEAIAFLRSNAPFYGFFYTGIMLHTMAVYAIPAWAPSLLARRFGLPLAEVGVRFGIVALVAGVGGMLTGPVLARLVGGPVWGMRLAVLATGLLALGLPWTASAGQTLALLFAIIFTTTLPLPLASAVLMSASPDRLRGFAGSIYFVLSGIVGLAIAPTLTGFLTDHLFKNPSAVGSALALVLSTGGIVSFALLLRLRLIKDD
ncbi:MAG: transporter [Novosphingobium sp.]|nr:transporter [Novosphingobium sp.]